MKDQEGQSASSSKISRQSIKPLLMYGKFSIFEEGGRRILEFSKYRHLGVGGSGGSKCVAVPNFAAIGQTVAEIWRLSAFLDLLCACLELWTIYTKRM